MATSYLVMLFYIANCFIHAESMQCIKCSTETYDSPCRLGTEKNTFECPSDEQSCYTEYFQQGSTPLYRRGCSPSDWCQTQKGLHDDYFKYCTTCEGENCNTGIIGAPDNSQIQCYTCETEVVDSDCRKGSIDNKIELCKPGIKRCSYHSITTTQKYGYARGCASDDHCSLMEKKYKNSLETCQTCEKDLCNTKTMV